MCMNDWRIGRLIRSQRRTFATPALASAGIKASQQRVQLSIVPSDAMAVITDSIAQDNPGLGITIGGIPVFVCTAFNQIYTASLLTHGDVPTLDHDVVDFGYSGAVNVLEWFMPENVLAESIKKFETEYGKWLL